MRRKILFVDDEVSFLKMIKLNLEATGNYEVLTESRGTRAVETAKAFRPDMIFLDLVMPDIDGAEVAYHLKDDALLAGVPVVFLTATVTADEVHQAGEMIGGQVFLAKPVTVKKLIECIKQTLGG